MAATESATPSPAEIVAREAAIRTRTGFAALLAALLTVVGGIVPSAVLSDLPKTTELDALRYAAGESIGRAGLNSDKVLFFDHHAVPLLLSAIAQGIASACVGLVLVVLHDAARARGATTPRVARTLAIFGAAAAAISVVALQVGIAVGASNFASSADHGTKAAHDALHGGVLVAASFLGLVGTLALAAAFVLIAVGAMRVGLLTRFVGILGAIVGALTVLGPFSSGSFIVTAFWLTMTAVLLLGRWPSGQPPAWDSGEARPWPSQQQIREARERDRTERGGGRGGRLRGAELPAGAPAPAEPAGGTPSPATSARKKRKRRS